MRSVGLWLLFAVLGTAALAAQEFHPPPVRSAGDGTRLGLFGFGVRAGIDLSGETQLVFGVTLDAGNLLSSRFRLRPSGEIGVFNGVNSYVGSLEGLYRFTGEGRAVTPYAGGGFSLVGHDRCGADPDCPDVWLNVVVGFELHYVGRGVDPPETAGGAARARGACAGHTPGAAAASLHGAALRVHRLGRRRGRSEGTAGGRSLAREVLLRGRLARPRHPHQLRRRAALAPFRIGVADFSSVCARTVGTGLGRSPAPRS